MEDHIHLIVSGHDLSATMRRFLGFTARQIVDSLQSENRMDVLGILERCCRDKRSNRRHQVWQRGYQPKVIQSHQTLVQKSEYILFNPVRKGLVSRPEDWRYTSLARSHGNLQLPATHPVFV